MAFPPKTWKISFSLFSLSSRLPFPNFSCNPLSNPFSPCPIYFSLLHTRFGSLILAFPLLFHFCRPFYVFHGNRGLCGGVALTMGKSYESKMDETRPRLRTRLLPTDLKDLCCPCWLCRRTKLRDEGRGVIIMDSCLFFVSLHSDDDL